MVWMITKRNPIYTGGRNTRTTSGATESFVLTISFLSGLENVGDQSHLLQDQFLLSMIGGGS